MNYELERTLLNRTPEARMKLQFAFIAIGLAFVVTACNSGGKKRVPFKKGAGSATEKDLSPRAKELNKASDGRKCMNLPSLINAFVKGGNEQYLIYSSDLDFGTIDENSPASGFQSGVDAKLRRAGLIGRRLIEPVQAQNLLNSSIGHLLAVSAIDSNCKTASITQSNGNGLNFSVISGNSQNIWLRNSTNHSEIISYHWDRRDRLIITHYTRNQIEICGKRPFTMLRKYVLAREKAMEKLTITRSFGEALAGHVAQAPAELTSELAKTSNNKMIIVSAKAMDEIAKQVSEEKVNELECK